MDRTTLTEVFNYDEWAWQQLIEELAPLGDELLTKHAPGSGWPALGNCLGHMIMAYEVWLNTLDGAPRVEEDTAPAIATWAEIDAFSKRVRERFRSTLAAMSDEQLHSDMTVDAFGDVFDYTPAELLGNTVIHERGHHGDVNTLLYQLSIDGGIPDYRWYVNFKRGCEYR